MASESLKYPKSRAVSISIFLSLVLHSVLLYINVKLIRERTVLPVAREQQIRPMMVLEAPPMRVPQRMPRIRAPRVRQDSPVMHAIKPAQPVPVTPQQSVPGGHRVYRVGTGFDAPDTDHALALGERNPQGRGGEPRVEQPTIESFKSVQPGGGVSESHGADDNTSESLNVADRVSDGVPDGRVTGRVPLRVAGAETGAQPRSGSRLKKQQATASVLSFLSGERFTEMMRQNMAHPDEPGGIGIPGHSGGVGQQHGDPRYLHYNSKIYTAIQESMNVTMAQMSRAQYQRLFEGTKQPARVRFSLDAGGKPHAIHISRHSGNDYYDELVMRIIAEASFPSIPSSFGMHVTYHDYGIILYADATPREQIGVSPYLEGE